MDQEIGNKIKNLSVGDRLKVTGHNWDQYVLGKVTSKTNNVDDKELYYATVTDMDGTLYRLEVNWRDIPHDADDQKTPITGIIQKPVTDTPQSVTDIQLI